MPFLDKVQLQHKLDGLKWIEKVRPFMKSDNFIKLFPFKIITGAQLTTNTGFKGLASYVENYNDLAMIFTGQEAVTAEWRDSVVLTQQKDDTDPTNKTKNYARRTKKIGTYFEGYLMQHYQAQQISIYAPNSDFQKLIISRTFEVFFILDRSTSALNNNDIIENFVQYEFDLFVCPEINKEFENPTLKRWPSGGENSKITEWNHQLFRPINVGFHYNDQHKIVGIDIKFASVNDFMSNTGLAIQQYINYGAAGQGYAFPAVDQYTRVVSLDQSVIKNIPITHAQVDFYGIAAISSLAFFGYESIEDRDADGNWYEDITTPSEIYFSQEFQVSLYDNTQQKAIAEENYYLLQNANIDLITKFDSWQKFVGNLSNPLFEKHYEGYLKVSKDPMISNPSMSGTDKTKYQFSVYDDVFMNDSALVRDFSLYTNLFINSIYFKDDKGNGDSDFSGYTAVPYSGLASFLMINHILYSNIHQLPVSESSSILVTENINFNLGKYLGKFAPFAGFFNQFLNARLPVNFRISSDITKSKFAGFDFLMSAPVYDLNSKQLNDKYIFMDVFRLGTKDQMTALGGQSSSTTSLLAPLTNVVEMYGFNGEVADSTPTNAKTYQCGQSAGSKRLFYTPKSKVKPNPNPQNGYIITGFKSRALAKTSFRISLFHSPYVAGGEIEVKNDDMVWMGYYKTLANVADNVNLWETTLILGNPFLDTQDTFAYPESYVTINSTNAIFAALDQSQLEGSVDNTFSSTSTTNNRHITISLTDPKLRVVRANLKLDNSSFNPNYTFANFKQLIFDNNFLIEATINSVVSLIRNDSGTDRPVTLISDLPTLQFPPNSRLVLTKDQLVAGYDWTFTSTGNLSNNYRNGMATSAYHLKFNFNFLIVNNNLQVTATIEIIKDNLPLWVEFDLETFETRLSLFELKIETNISSLQNSGVIKYLYDWTR